jgi:hypothetical protein
MLLQLYELRTSPTFSIHGMPRYWTRFSMWACQGGLARGRCPPVTLFHSEHILTQSNSSWQGGAQTN